MFSSAAAFFYTRWRLWSICHIKRHNVFHIILLTFLQILYSKIPSPGKLVKTRHIWRHDLQIKSTGPRRSKLIGDSCSRCERVDNSTSSWVELRRRSVYSDADATQLNCRYKRPLNCLVFVVFEKIAFFCILATDRQTDGQHRCTKPLSLSRAAA